MTRYLRHLIPVRIGSQIAALIVVSLLLAHVIMTGGFFLRDAGPSRPLEWVGVTERLVFLTELLEHEKEADARSKLLADAQRVESGLEVLNNAPPLELSARDSPILNNLQHQLGNNTTLFISRRADQQQNGGGYQAVAGLSDGKFIAIPLRGSIEPPRLLPPVLLGTLVFLGSAVALLSLWAARQLTAPLARLADAAEKFSIDASDTELVESGPIEVQRTARALKDMQDRVLKLIAERTRMLAAVSHDLRTPITRLRLRAEEIEPESLRRQFLRDLTIMQNLVQSTLSFLRGQYGPRQTVTADLAALVQTVCDDFADAEGRLQFDGLPPHVYVECEPDQLMRAISNLIDNGLKFGEAVTVRMVELGNGLVSIDIQDQGPGIPDAEKARAMEPYYRGDQARNLTAGDSFGLGLSIAQTIIRRHGGMLDLLDACPRGLLARIALPIVHPAEPQTDRFLPHLHDRR